MDRVPPKRGEARATDTGADQPLKQADSWQGGGDMAAVFRRYSAWLRRKLSRLYGPDQAEDLAQEAFLRAAKCADTSTSIGKPQALLLRIARNAAVDGYRRGPRGQAVALDQVLDHVSLVQAAEQEQLVLLKQVVLTMPPPLRDVFVLNRFAGMTYAEISQRMGISQKTVEWRMARALSHCATAMKGN